MDLFSNSRNATLLFFAISLAAILTALAFEHFGGYKPCPLCLQERYAYYAGIPLSAAALAAHLLGNHKSAAIFIALAGLGYLINSGLGLYHSGVEWQWWAGPTVCSGSRELSFNAGNLLENLKTIKVIRCDQAPWRFIGLSFAGWSAIISFFLFLFSFNIFKSLRQA